MKEKYSFIQKADAMELYDLGFSLDEISSRLGLSRRYLKMLTDRYRVHGQRAFTHEVLSVSEAQKQSIALEIINKSISLCGASVKYNIALSTLHKWKVRYEPFVCKGVYSTEPPPIRPIMKKEVSRLKTELPHKENTEAYIRKLEQELLYAKAECSFLKKYQALIRKQKKDKR